MTPGEYHGQKAKRLALKGQHIHRTYRTVKQGTKRRLLREAEKQLELAKVYAGLTAPKGPSSRQHERALMRRQIGRNRRPERWECGLEPSQLDRRGWVGSRANL